MNQYAHLFFLALNKKKFGNTFKEMYIFKELSFAWKFDLVFILIVWFLINLI